MNCKQNSYEKTEMYKKAPLHFSMVTSTFPNFPVENLESTRAKPPRQGIRANNANCIIWVKHQIGQFTPLEKATDFTGCVAIETLL